MAAWAEKMGAAKGQCWVDVGFWGGVVPGEDPLIETCLKHFLSMSPCRQTKFKPNFILPTSHQETLPSCAKWSTTVYVDSSASSSTAEWMSSRVWIMKKLKKLSHSSRPPLLFYWSVHKVSSSQMRNVLRK